VGRKRPNRGSIHTRRLREEREAKALSDLQAAQTMYGSRHTEVRRAKAAPIVGCLYHSRRGLTLTLVALLCLAMPLFTAILLGAMSQVQRMEEFGQGPQSWMLPAGIFLLSVAPLLAIAWLSGRYVLQIDRDGEGNLHIETWTLLGRRSRSWPASADWKPMTQHAGTAQFARAPSVNAPYLTLHPVGGRRMIVDLQGELPHGVAALEAVVLPSESQ